MSTPDEIEVHAIPATLAAAFDSDGMKPRHHGPPYSPDQSRHVPHPLPRFFTSRILQIVQRIAIDHDNSDKRLEPIFEVLVLSVKRHVPLNCDAQLECSSFVAKDERRYMSPMRCQPQWDTCKYHFPGGRHNNITPAAFRVSS